MSPRKYVKRTDPAVKDPASGVWMCGQCKRDIDGAPGDPSNDSRLRFGACPECHRQAVFVVRTAMR